MVSALSRCMLHIYYRRSLLREKNMEPELMRNNKKKIILIAVIAAVIASAVGIGVVLSSASPAKRLQQQLDLGARYLSEPDYEQAIAAYEAALEIEPKSAEAYGGLVAAYGGQNDISAVVDTYVRASDALDPAGLEDVSAKANAAVQEYVDELVAEEREEEALVVLESVAAVLNTEEIRARKVQIQGQIAEKASEWESRCMKSLSAEDICVRPVMRFMMLR